MRQDMPECFCPRSWHTIARSPFRQKLEQAWLMVATPTISALLFGLSDCLLKWMPARLCCPFSLRASLVQPQLCRQAWLRRCCLHSSVSLAVGFLVECCQDFASMNIYLVLSSHVSMHKDRCRTVVNPTQHIHIFASL